MNILITMAGEGARFRSAGYTVPKFAIEVRGKTLLQWSLESLLNFSHSHFIFISRSEHKARALIDATCKALGFVSWELLELDAATDGQAATASAAQTSIADLTAAVAIYNIDTYVEPHAISPSMIRGDGWLPVFKASGDYWSFVSCDNNGRVSEVAEKRPISDLATIGFYYFRSFELFAECLQKYSFQGYQERFVAPIYEHLLQSGRYSVYTDILPKGVVHVLGTPEQVQAFEASLAV